MCFFKVKHYFGHISGMVGPIDVKRKGSALVGYWVQYVTLTFDLPHDLDLGCFKVKFQNSSICRIVGRASTRIFARGCRDISRGCTRRKKVKGQSKNIMSGKIPADADRYRADRCVGRRQLTEALVGLIDVKWKGSELIWYWAICMTLPIDHTHDLDLGVSRSESEIALYQEWGSLLTMNEKDASHPFITMILTCVTMTGWADVPDSDRGDFRRRRAVDISSFFRSEQEEGVIFTLST